MLRATVAFAIGMAIAQAQTPPPVPQTPVPAPTPPPSPPSLEVTWKLALTAAEERQTMPWLVSGDTRVFVSDPLTGVSAHSKTDGKLVWTLAGATLTPPVIVGANVLLASAGELQVVAQETGRAVMRAPFEGQPILAFSSADRIGVVVEGRMQAWGLDGAPAWTAPLARKPVTNVVVAGNLLVIGTDEPALVAFDAGSGAAAWTIRLRARPTALSATAERVFFGGDDGALYAYSTTGQPKLAWRSKRIRSIGLPVVESDSVYFALLDNSIRAFNAGGGSQRWSQVVESRPLIGPLKLKDSLGIALTNGRVVELSPETGKPLGPTSAMATGSVRLLTAAAARDGAQVYTITIGNDFSRTLAAWERQTVSAR